MTAVPGIGRGWPVGNVSGRDMYSFAIKLTSVAPSRMATFAGAREGQVLTAFPSTLDKILYFPGVGSQDMMSVECWYWTVSTNNTLLSFTDTLSHERMASSTWVEQFSFKIKSNMIDWLRHRQGTHYCAIETPFSEMFLEASHDIFTFLCQWILFGTYDNDANFPLPHGQPYGHLV